MKQNFTYLSKDKETQIHAIAWKPDGEIRVILQICHGMVEFIDRYSDFAEYEEPNSPTESPMIIYCGSLLSFPV